MTRPIEALPRGDFSPLSCPCPYGAHRFFPIIAQDFSPGSSSVPFFTRAPLGGTPLPLNNNPGFQPWVVPAWGHPCPCGCRSSKKEMAVTRVVKEGYIYDQTYRGSASRGLQSPFLPVPLSGAHHFFPIIAQGFNPGWPCAPAASRQRKMIIAQGPRVETLGYDKACKACPAGAHSVISKYKSIIFWQS